VYYQAPDGFVYYTAPAPAEYFAGYDQPVYYSPVVPVAAPTIPVSPVQLYSPPQGPAPPVAFQPPAATTTPMYEFPAQVRCRAFSRAPARAPRRLAPQQPYVSSPYAFPPWTPYVSQDFTPFEAGEQVCAPRPLRAPRAAQRTRVLQQQLQSPYLPPGLLGGLSPPTQQVVSLCTLLLCACRPLNGSPRLRAQLERLHLDYPEAHTMPPSHPEAVSLTSSRLNEAPSAEGPPRTVLQEARARKSQPDERQQQVRTPCALSFRRRS
jgi:hypothetical protein